MISVLCPVKKTIWGELKTIDDLNRAITRSGQPFGVDWSGPACNTIPSAPCDKTYYQYLGFGLHQGIDIPVETGTEVHAAHDGKVVRLSDKITAGLGVVLYDPIQQIQTVYWHLKLYTVTLGQEVKKDDIIAISDNTGYSTGPHLHFELHNTDNYGNSLPAIDPIPYIRFKDDMDIMFADFITNFYLLYFGRQPDADELKFWIGKDYRELFLAALNGRAKNFSDSKK